MGFHADEPLPGRPPLPAPPSFTPQQPHSERLNMGRTPTPSEARTETPDHASDAGSCISSLTTGSSEQVLLQPDGRPTQRFEKFAKVTTDLTGRHKVEEFNSYRRLASSYPESLSFFEGGAGSTNPHWARLNGFQPGCMTEPGMVQLGRVPSDKDILKVHSRVRHGACAPLSRMACAARARTFALTRGALSGACPFSCSDGALRGTHGVTHALVCCADKEARAG